MKKLVLFLICVPIFLITSLNFSSENEDINHPIESRAFTCTSCHATIIDGIIVGKDEFSVSTDYVELDLVVPSDIAFNGIILNINGDEETTDYLINDLGPYLNDIYGQLFALDISSNQKGKKENTIKVKYLISNLDRENGILELQGVLSNLDSKPGGEYSFYKKIDLNTSSSKKELSVYPTIAHQYVFIDNVSQNALIQIINIKGQVVFEQTAQNDKEQINISDFENGNYFVFIQNDESFSKSKFIVSK